MADIPESLVEQEQQAAEVLQRQGDARKDVVAEAAAAVRELRGPDTDEPEDIAAEVATDVEAPVEETVAETETPSEEPEPILLQDDDGNQYIKLVVDGEEQTMSIADAQVELQKRISGDHRMNEAQQLRAQAQRDLEAAQERERQIQMVQARAEQETADEEIGTSVRDAVSEILNGDVESASEKLTATLMAARNAPATPATPETASQDASLAEAQARQVAEVQAAYGTFTSEFSDLNMVQGSPDFVLADTYATQVEAEHPDWSPLQVMREAGNQVRAFKGAAQVDANDDGSDARSARRANLKPLPPAGGGAEDLTEQQYKARTAEEIVEAMNKQRRGRLAA